MKKGIVILIAIALFAGSCNRATKQQTAETDNNPQNVQTTDETDLRSESTAFPQCVEGRWMNTEDENCNMFLTLANTTEGWTFYLQVREKFYEGNVTFSDNENGKYVVLQGIPWVKYIGQLEEDADPDEIEGTPTFGIDLRWEDDELVFQNYGNSMNYYQVLECGDKYVTFVRLSGEN